jgi:hypothetical protein
MTLVRQWGRPTGPTLALIAVGLVRLIAGLFGIHGSTPVHVTRGHGRVVPSDRTGTREDVRFILDVSGVVLALYGVYRWNTQRERDPGEDGRRLYGDEPAADARPSAAPLTGFPPPDTDDRPRT